MRPTRSTVVFSFAIFSILSAGCGQTLPERSPDDSFTCTDCEDAEPTDDETEPTVEVDPPETSIDPAPVEPQSPDAICAPRPAVREATDYPELPDRATDPSCPLTATRRDRDGDGTVETTTDWSRGDGSIIKAHDGPGASFATVHWVRGWTADGDRQLRFVERRRRTSRYKTNVDVDSWSFDRQGRLVKKTDATLPERGADEPIRRQTLEQTFRDGRLVSRTRTSEYDDGERTRRETTYNWNDGRLTEIVHEVDDLRRWVADWQYQDGRPVRVAYTLNGEDAYEQTWAFHADGRLDSRSIVFQSALIDDRGFRSLPELTSMTPAHVVSASPYARTTGPSPSSTFEDRDDCRQLPSSARHGYPQSERIYRAGFLDGSVPRDADHAYGSPGYGVYGDNAWYGHSGIFSAGPLTRSNGDPDGDGLRVTIDYDDRERMVRESTTFDTRADAPVRVERTRTFAGDDLVEDRLIEMRGELAQHRTLEFRYEDGRLNRRLLRIDGEVAAKQSWTVRDGRDVELAISHREGDRGRRLQNDPGTSPSFDDVPFETTTYRREFDDQGRRTRFTVDPHGVYTDEIRTTYGPHGPVERIEGQGEHRTRTRFEYDDAGRRIAEKQDRNDDGSYEHIERWNYDAEGRLIERTRQRDSGRITFRRSEVYACTTGGE